METADLVAAMERIAPLSLAESWDNVGLLVGDPRAELAPHPPHPCRVLLTIDCTAPVIDEALEAKCAAIVAYHPPLFASMKRVVAPSLAYRLVRSGLAVYSPHTALDAAKGGTNDALADLVGMRDRRPLRPATSHAEGSLRLVTFVPTEAADVVAQALFSAGAGCIGAYRECSFRSVGEGTFFGEEGTEPRVGQALRRELVPEVKLETTLPESRAAAVVAALRAAHPYEEPAFDLLRRENELAAARRGAKLGQGRIGSIDADRGEIIARVQEGIARGSGGLLVAGPREGAARTVAVLAGSAGELLRLAIDQGADVVLTGEARHHDALAAAARGVTVIATLHSNSERLALPPLAARLRTELPGVEVLVSQRDADPFTFV